MPPPRSFGNRNAAASARSSFTSGAGRLPRGVARQASRITAFPSLWASKTMTRWSRRRSGTTASPAGPIASTRASGCAAWSASVVASAPLPQSGRADRIVTVGARDVQVDRPLGSAEHDDAVEPAVPELRRDVAPGVRPGDRTRLGRAEDEGQLANVPQSGLSLHCDAQRRARTALLADELQGRCWGSSA